MHALPRRAGGRPTTTSHIPHTQIDQQPPDSRYLTEVLTAASTWPRVRLGASGISVEGARALLLVDDVPVGPAEAFMVGREFAHGHAQGDHSLHLTLPLEVVDEVEAAGWAEPHFLVQTGHLPRTHVMVYAPREREEVMVALDIVRESYKFATSANAITLTTHHPSGERR